MTTLSQAQIRRRPRKRGSYGPVDVVTLAEGLVSKGEAFQHYVIVLELPHPVYRDQGNQLELMTTLLPISQPAAGKTNAHDDGW